jgi:hypothetical protein
VVNAPVAGIHEALDAGRQRGDRVGHAWALADRQSGRKLRFRRVGESSSFRGHQAGNGDRRLHIPKAELPANFRRSPGRTCRRAEWICRIVVTLAMKTFLLGRLAWEEWVIPMKYLSFLIVPWLLASCSLVGDAVDISERRSNQLAKGAKVEGEGFSVRVPDSGLYPKKDFPLRGGITFRPTEPMFDGQVYFVTPFPFAAEDTHQALNAWNQIPRSKGSQVNVLKERKVTFQGFKATEATVEVPQSKGGQIAAVLVVKRSRDFLILTRGEFYRFPSDRARMLRVCTEGLVELKRSIVIHAK